MADNVQDAMDDESRQLLTLTDSQLQGVSPRHVREM